jgi:hypothetical protein
MFNVRLPVLSLDLLSTMTSSGTCPRHSLWSAVDRNHEPVAGAFAAIFAALDVLKPAAVGVAVEGRGD